MVSTIKLLDKHMAGEKPDVTLVPGTVIAGGAVRRWFSGEKQDSDIDIFCKDSESEKSFITINNLVERSRNDRIVMFIKSPIQLILKPQLVTPEDLLDHFDFVHCQFAYDGTEIITTIEAILSVARKHLAVHSIQKGFEIDSLRRAFKYAKQGYWPCIGTIRDLCKAINSAEVTDLTKFDTISPDRWD